MIVIVTGGRHCCRTWAIKKYMIGMIIGAIQSYNKSKENHGNKKISTLLADSAS